MSQAQLPSQPGPCIPESDPESKPTRQPLTEDQLIALGRLLRDRREEAGLSRTQLGRKAKLSDCTIKFIESARHCPRKATLQSLIAVAALKLSWRDLPGHPGTPTTPDAQAPEPVLP